MLNGMTFLELFANWIVQTAGDFFDGLWLSVKPRPGAMVSRLKALREVSNSAISVIGCTAASMTSRDVKAVALMSAGLHRKVIKKITFWREQYSLWKGVDDPDFETRDKYALQVIRFLSDQFSEGEKHLSKKITRHWALCGWEGCGSFTNLKVCSRWANDIQVDKESR